jgi:hypothetical protein
MQVFPELSESQEERTKVQAIQLLYFIPHATIDIYRHNEAMVAVDRHATSQQD